MSDTNINPDINSNVAESYTRIDTEPILQVKNLSKQFGGVTALENVNLEVRNNEIAALVGPNGAGKSTLFNCITGVYGANSGSVYLHDTEITDMNTPLIVQQGLSRTFQHARVFENMSVFENLLVNQPHDNEGMFPTLVRKSDKEVVAQANELIEFVELEHLADERAGSLSGGQKKLLNLACTLVSEPDVVLLDEPTAGVNPNLIDDITESVIQLNRQRNTTFLIIEHDMDVIHEISDHVYVFANATNLIDGAPDAALSDQRVLEAYFGR